MGLTNKTNRTNQTNETEISMYGHLAELFAYAYRRWTYVFVASNSSLAW